jgi:hypothetical protein
MDFKKLGKIIVVVGIVVFVWGVYLFSQIPTQEALAGPPRQYNFANALRGEAPMSQELRLAEARSNVQNMQERAVKIFLIKYVV